MEMRLKIKVEGFEKVGMKGEKGLLNVRTVPIHGMCGREYT